MPGEDNGNNGSPTKSASPTFGLHTLGLSATRIILPSKPTSMPVMAPAILKRFQYTVNQMTGKLELAATVNANDERKATFIF